MDVIAHDGALAYADLPGKFSDDVSGGGVGGLEVAKVFTQVVGGGNDGAANGRQVLADRDIVPVALVFAEITKTPVGIEEQIFVPVVADTVGLDAAALEADDFVVGAAEFSARAERDEGLEFAGDGLELLENLERGIFGVEDGVAIFADDRYGLLERA